MQYVPPSMDQPKKLARSLRRMCLEVCDIELTHSQALEIVARMYGWPNWFTMHKTLIKGARPTRASCEEDVAVRWVLSVNVLSAVLAIGDDEAGEIVDRLRPNTLRIWTDDDRGFGR